MSTLPVPQTSAADHSDRRESDQRPWGNYLVLEDAVDHKVKRITVSAGMRLSYQRHARRSTGSCSPGGGW